MSRVETLASAGDLARILDVSRATIYAWQRRDDFPDPIGTVGNARVWKVADVVKWERDNPRTAGRPKHPRPAGS